MPHSNSRREDNVPHQSPSGDNTILPLKKVTKRKRNRKKKGELKQSARQHQPPIADTQMNSGGNTADDNGDAVMAEVGSALPQQRGRPRESNTPSNAADRTVYQQKRRTREDTVMEELQELKMISLNIRGFNKEAKHYAISDLIRENDIHVVCLNETKLTIPVYFDNYWSHQTMLQRNGGCWTAATNKVKLTLVKALGTYLCWMRLTTGRHVIQLLNCYLEPGD